MPDLSDNEYLCIVDGEVQIIEGHGHMKPAGRTIANNGAGTGVSVALKGCKHLYEYMEERDNSQPFDMQFTLASYNGDIWESALLDAEWMGSVVCVFPHDEDERFLEQLLAHDQFYFGFTYPDVDEAPDECEACRNLDDVTHIEHLSGFATSNIRNQLMFLDRYVGEPVTQSPGDKIVAEP